MLWQAGAPKGRRKYIINDGKVNGDDLPRAEIPEAGYGYMFQNTISFAILMPSGEE
jgi:hypothetical protein